MRVGWSDFSLFWNKYTWLSAWLVGVTGNAVTWVFLSAVLQSDTMRVQLLIGVSVWTGINATGWTIPASTWDRQDGTYPLLVVAPGRLIWPVLGRTIVWPMNGVATAMATAAILSVLMGPVLLAWHWPLFLLTSILCCAAMYGASLALGGFINRWPQLRNVAFALFSTSIMAFGGVGVPVDFWNPVVSSLAHLLPLTNGLMGLRLSLTGGSGHDVVLRFVAEIAVACFWFGIAFLVVERAASRGRMDGSIEWQ